MKKTLGEKITFIVVFVIFVAYAIYLLFPFAFAINSSLRSGGFDVDGFPTTPSREFMDNMLIFAWPPNFNNYIEAFSELKVGKIGFVEMLINSVVYAGGATFMGIMSSTFLAYAVSRYNFKIKNFLYGLALFTMIIPIYGSAPANYRLLTQLGLTNNWGYLLCTAGGFGFNFLIIYSFFQAISKEYMEAAFIDGATHYGVFFKIMLPMAIPSITAIVITAFIGAWNDYMTPLLYFKKLSTLSAGLYLYKNESMYAANDVAYLAGVIISMIPVVVIFIAFQNTVMEKVYAGGLKG